MNPSFDLDDEDQTSSVLPPLLAPITHWLLGQVKGDKDVYYENIEEIAINRPKEIWIKLRKPTENGENWVPRYDESLTRDKLELIIYTLANVSETSGFGPRGNPTTFGTLPGGHRYAAALGPNIQYKAGELSPRGTILFCARQFKPEHGIRLENYGLAKNKGLEPVDHTIYSKEHDSTDPLTKIMASIERGDHILLSGPTGTGKTSFLNHVIKLLPQTLRVVTVEDTSEIVVTQPNHIHLILNRSGQTNNFTYAQVVDLVVRMTPDVVMAGEISTKNAATVWELMRSGHGHFLTTIHAENAHEAISSFIDRIRHTLEVHDPEKLAKDMLAKLRIIQIYRDNKTNKRRVSEVL